MIPSDSIFVGITPATSRNSFTYAVLDKNLRLLYLKDDKAEDVTAFLAQHQTAIVAINSPVAPSRTAANEKKNEKIRQSKTRMGDFRAAEHELRKHGIVVTGTPAVATACSGKVQAGFALYRTLGKMGFAVHPAEPAPRQVLETHSHACFCTLAEHTPLPKLTLEGKIQRQLLLYEKGLGIQDPMDFFEEITRHKMLKGLWPLNLLYQPTQLDALVAAYTAWHTAHHPEKSLALGDPKEGMITLPIAQLKEKYESPKW